MDHPGEGGLLESEVMPAPSADAQLAFLAKLQRLFAEGDFTATYKFALLTALADLAVELGSDDGQPLPLSNRSIASKFIELYWQQTAPYSTGRPGIEPGVLAQNNGARAAVVTAILEFRLRNPVATAQSARTMPGYTALVQQVAQTVSAQPLNYLQNLGGQTDQFLYERAPGQTILLPGVGYCLRRFQPLVQQLARSHWVAHLKRNRLNLPLLGNEDDLEAFLFETPRQVLAVVCTGLRGLTNDRCFYCGKGLHEADVDHFVPFSMYPRDLMHNFVLAHPACNRSKSDALTGREHLERWMEYIVNHDDALQEIGRVAGRTMDIVASRAIARWSYSNAVTSGAQAWLRAGVYEKVGSDYMRSWT
jgi:5-methylcytosine-specific restriction endonuclease McrA